MVRVSAREVSSDLLVFAMFVASIMAVIRMVIH
jgi:hypothetical protein